jgi:hypothetical protein
MKTGSDKGKLTAIDLDLRVRDRQVANGTLDPKALERHLAELTDLEAQSEIMQIEQPALGGGAELGRSGPSAGST